MNDRRARCSPIVLHLEIAEVLFPKLLPLEVITTDPHHAKVSYYVLSIADRCFGRIRVVAVRSQAWLRVDNALGPNRFPSGLVEALDLPVMLGFHVLAARRDRRGQEQPFADNNGCRPSFTWNTDLPLDLRISTPDLRYIFFKNEPVRVSTTKLKRIVGEDCVEGHAAGNENEK